MRVADGPSGIQVSTVIVVGPRPRMVFEVMVIWSLVGMVGMIPSVEAPMKAPPSSVIRQLMLYAGAPMFSIVVVSFIRLVDNEVMESSGPVMLAVVMSVPWRLF